MYIIQSIVSTVAFRGIETLDVSVQVHMSNALPAKRIAVNLSPADLLKEGAHFDLPIAMGLLTAMGVLPSDCLSEHILLGELSLDGSVRQVTGIWFALPKMAQRQHGRAILPSLPLKI